MESPDPVTEFMSCTGCTEEVAIQMLSLSEYNLEKAVQLYFDNDMDPTASSGGQLNHTKSSCSSNSEAIYSDVVEEEEVRKPIPSKRQRLLSGPSSVLPGIYSPPLTMTSAFASGSGNPGSISGLYKPPFRIMFKGSFQEARDRAVEENKWILVNIQKEDVFASHILNSDVWSDEGFQEALLCSFIFWQHQHFTVQGKWFIESYLKGQGESYPHVSVVDPVTGSVTLTLKNVDKNPSKKAIFERLMDFLSSKPSPSEYWDAKSQKISSDNSVPSTLNSSLPTPDPPSENPSQSTETNSSRKLSSSKPEMDSTSDSQSGFLAEDVASSCSADSGSTGSSIRESKSKGGVIRVVLPDGRKIDARADSLGNLLIKVTAEFTEAERKKRFDLFSGFPPRSISDTHRETSKPDLLAFSVEELGLVGQKVSLRFLD
mmetsp:Transcript_2821/g.4273  ORF Transcript_2821/g.4273 Transcript_2821/m.4273 type:complete len:430 (-) Transcript_2821:118-1407(-)